MYVVDRNCENYSGKSMQRIGSHDEVRKLTLTTNFTFYR